MLEKPKSSSSETLRKPPKIWGTFSDYITVAICIILGLFACVSKNWVGVSIDIAMIVIYIVTIWFRWRHSVKLYKTYETLIELYEIIKMPSFREEGNSIILTAVFPSSKLILDFENIKKSRRPK